MTDELKLRRQVERSAHAERLMKDDLLNEAFSEIENEYMEFWRETPVRDQDARERIFHAVNVIGKVKQHLIAVLNDGKVAKKELDDFLSRQTRKTGVK